jgi:hypothetical protein
MSMRIFLPMAFALVPAAAWAWGPEGHSIIAEIAQREMGTDARDAIQKLLGRDSLASVASWADDVKYTDHQETRSWHFINIPLEQAAYDHARGDCKDDDGNDDTCMLAHIDAVLHQLRCGKDEADRRDALRYLVHFVGDLTQPLHSVKEKHGANLVEATLSFCGKKWRGHCPVPPPDTPPTKVPLHEVWDSTLITSTFWDWGAYVDRLYAAPDGWLTTAEATKWDVAAGSFEDWANDTHKQAEIVWKEWLGRDSVTDANAKVVIDQAYYDKALAIVDRQLGIGGLRLARLLNEALSSSRCPGP